MNELEIVVLSVPDCPNAAVALHRSTDAAALVGGSAVRAVLVESEEAARELGMHGSPTITIGGVDPFSPLDATAQLACRVRPGEDPVPSVEEIAAAIARHRVD